MKETPSISTDRGNTQLTHSRKQLMDRILRFISHGRCAVWIIPVYPDELSDALALREGGYIPSIPLTVYGTNKTI